MTGMVVAPDPPSMEDYLSGVSPEARIRLEGLRALVRELAPDAVESIAYGMPTFTLPGQHRFHAAAWSKHVGVYPVHMAPDPLEARLAPLRTAKDTVRLAYDVPFDADLVRELVAFLLERPA
jgi:uncharacterized protein YdhG (YjbR/CyaY superfamily)